MVNEGCRLANPSSKNNYGFWKVNSHRGAKRLRQDHDRKSDIGKVSGNVLFRFGNDTPDSERRSKW
jgi:hypothetical protein